MDLRQQLSNSKPVQQACNGLARPRSSQMQWLAHLPCLTICSVAYVCACRCQPGGRCVRLNRAPAHSHCAGARALPPAAAPGNAHCTTGRHSQVQVKTGKLTMNCSVQQTADSAAAGAAASAEDAVAADHEMTVAVLPRHVQVQARTKHAALLTHRQSGQQQQAAAAAERSRQGTAGQQIRAVPAAAAVAAATAAVAAARRFNAAAAAAATQQSHAYTLLQGLGHQGAQHQHARQPHQRQRQQPQQQHQWNGHLMQERADPGTCPCCGDQMWCSIGCISGQTPTATARWGTGVRWWMACVTGG